MSQSLAATANGNVLASSRKSKPPDAGPKDSAGSPNDGAADRTDTWHYLVRFLGLVKPYMPFIWVILLCVMITNMLSLVMPFSMKVLIDSILPRRDMAMLNLLALGLVGFIVFRACFTFLQQYAMSYVGQRLLASVRLRLHAHLHRQSLSFLHEVQAGGVVSRVVGDVNSVNNLLFGGFISFASSVMRLLIVFTVLMVLNWRLTLISCIFLPFFAATYLRMRHLLRPAAKEIRHLWSRLTARLAEVFAGVALVKTYGKERRENLLFGQKIHVIMRKSLRVRIIDLTLQRTAEIVSGLGTITLLWFGGYEISQGRMTLGALIAFHGMLGMLFSPMAQIVQINNQIQAALASIERIFDILDTEPEIDDPPDAVKLPTLRGDVVFDHVTFAYSAEEGEPQTVLHGIDFHVEPGETIALVGPSGSGKTTIVNLLCRFYDVEPGQGGVRIDGYDLHRLNQRAYRKHIGYVGQENILFQGTMRENIAYGRSDATDEEILEAARQANALEFIDEMEKGLDTHIGSAGCTLSGGQRQRVCIARALLTDPRILVLDEATSMLDSKSEAQIQQALERLMKGRTCFVIAHRLSTIVHADKIIVLDKGHIREMGTHEELLGDSDGLYYAMFMEQYGKVAHCFQAAESVRRRDRRAERARRTPSERRRRTPSGRYAAAVGD